MFYAKQVFHTFGACELRVNKSMYRAMVGPAALGAELQEKLEINSILDNSHALSVRMSISI